MSSDTQLQMAQEARVIVKKTDVRGAGRINVSGDAGCAKGLAVDEGEVIDLAWLKLLIRDSWLLEWRRNRDQLFVSDGRNRTHFDLRSLERQLTPAHAQSSDLAARFSCT